MRMTIKKSDGTEVDVPLQNSGDGMFCVASGQILVGPCDTVEVRNGDHGFNLMGALPEGALLCGVVESGFNTSPEW
jgi:hypothetical protein